MAHLEDLLVEWYQWQGYIVRQNIFVGRRQNGGWDGELDVVAYHPQTRHLLHVEASLDAHSWAKREARFTKKFTAARQAAHSEVFPWLTPDIVLEHLGVLPSARAAGLAGAAVLSVDDLMALIVAKIREHGVAAKAAIPEQYALLRAIQFAVVGYYRVA